MNENTWIVEVPAGMTRGLRIAPVIVLVAALACCASLLLASQVAYSFPFFAALPPSDHRLVLKGLLFIWGVAAMLAVLTVKFLAYLPIATRVSSLIRDLTGDDDIFPILRRRLIKTAFVYLDGDVPIQLRITKISDKPNADGTYWMMKTNKNFSKLTLQKYRPGEIPEPKNPDATEVKYPWLRKLI